jgi:hypothetical protein
MYNLHGRWSEYGVTLYESLFAVESAYFAKDISKVDFNPVASGADLALW